MKISLKISESKPGGYSIQSISLVTLPFRFVFPSVPYVAPCVLLLLRSLLPPHCFNLFIHLFLSFKRLRSVRSMFSLQSSVLFFLLFLSGQLVHLIASVCVRIFVATLPFHSFVTSFLSFQLFVIPFAPSSLSFQLFLSVPYTPFLPI